MSRGTLVAIIVVVVLGLGAAAVLALVQFHMLRDILPFHFFHYLRRSF